MNQTTSPEQKDALFKEWQNSGLTKKEFCEKKQLSYQTFIWWFSRKKIKEKKSGFVPVQVDAVSGANCIEIHLSNSRKVIITGSVKVDLIQAILKC